MRKCDVEKFVLARSKEENTLRKLLFMSHKHNGHPDARYGDDGEMQCNTCFCDFVRDSAEGLSAKMGDWNMKEYIRLNPIINT